MIYETVIIGGREYYAEFHIGHGRRDDGKIHFFVGKCDVFLKIESPKVVNSVVEKLNDRIAAGEFLDLPQ